MEAYAALLSLAHTIDQIQNHPRPPISFHKLQIKSLIEMVTHLLHFLQNYSIDDADGLVGRMAEVAHKAEDIIESHIADHFEDEYEVSLFRYIQKMMEESDAAHETEDINESHIVGEDNSLYGELQKVMPDLDSITKDVAAVKEKAGKKNAPSCMEDDATLGSDDVMNNLMDKHKLNSEGDDTMVGSDDVMYDVINRLTDQQSNRRIIAITGMGGIGKTTLAKRIYENPLIVEQFDIRGWATISQEFDSKRILLQVFDCLKTIGNGDEFVQMSEHELGDTLYKILFGRRYLIVMDDIWGTNVWDKVKPFFPENNNGSKVLISTRLLNVASQLDGPDYFQMPFLNPEKSWKLLCRCVFGEQEWPPELEDIGKVIAGNCGGLPLSIVVVGGLLAKSEQTRENWQHVLENLSSIVNLEEDKHCFRILQLSYNQLPVHLKPCFLYMMEDHIIHVPTLIKLWVDEGFVKPVAGKSLESIAREVYLHGLVIRNLILVREWGYTRRVKRCAIHDLLRDLCIKEAEKNKFFRTTQNLNNVHDKSRRIGIHQGTSEWYNIPPPLSVQSASQARTLILNVNGYIPSTASFRLLRVLKVLDKSYVKEDPYSGQEYFLPVNLCHLAARWIELPIAEFYRLWNLRTLIVDVTVTWLLLDIWRMPQLRHIKVYNFQLKDPPPLPMNEQNSWMVLEKLETLQTVHDLRLTEIVVERIPNINKLGIRYEEEKLSPADYGLNNLCRLRKLECLSISCASSLSRRIEVTLFPVSLRKLDLEGTYLRWEEMGRKIGSLPYLEALKLYENAFVGPEWESAEGGFPSLKYLKIERCRELERWRAEATHFPRLERLQLQGLNNLKEIPLGIGEITTLREIRVWNCSDSVVLSARKILEEQEECYGEVELQIRVSLHNETQLRKESLRSRNLHFSESIRNPAFRTSSMILPFLHFLTTYHE
ncbi:disease resistance protein [Striga asiatica]|uniref:Disease resistance protein n=1 Tax=Striga asiatica TaxID=4170 RepID=A0A5A7R7Z3_STRAF|nr:disease resistance protein [Striga asiatica]